MIIILFPIASGSDFYLIYFEAECSESFKEPHLQYGQIFTVPLNCNTTLYWSQSMRCYYTHESKYSATVPTKTSSCLLVKVIIAEQCRLPRCLSQGLRYLIIRCWSVVVSVWKLQKWGVDEVAVDDDVRKVVVINTSDCVIGVLPKLRRGNLEVPIQLIRSV